MQDGQARRGRVGFGQLGQRGVVDGQKPGCRGVDQGQTEGQGVVFFRRLLIQEAILLRIVAQPVHQAGPGGEIDLRGPVYGLIPALFQVVEQVEPGYFRVWVGLKHDVELVEQQL